MKDVTLRRTGMASLNRLALCAFVVMALVFSATAASAQSTIKRPGAHPRYSVELEPHALVQWFDEPFGDAGFGLGMRAAIPFFHNGPIQKINNNMGIGFGLDWTHFEEDACYWGGIVVRGGPVRGVVLGPGWECTGNQLWFPVYMQWNFFLTDIISVFGEPGFALRYESVDIGGYDDSNIRPRLIFQGGGRFLFGDTVGLTVRVLYPFFPTVGASFLL